MGLAAKGLSAMAETTFRHLQVKTEVGRYVVQGASASSVTQDVTITNKNFESFKVVLSSALVLNEDTRSVSSVSDIGTVTGGSYPDTGATSQTLVIDPASSTTLRFTHSMDATPEDALGNAMLYQVQTPILAVTITEQGGVNTTDVGPAYYPLGTLLYGPSAEAVLASGLKFPTRSMDVPKALNAFFGNSAGNITAANQAKMLDWIENGGSLYRLVEVADVLSALDAGLPSALNDAQSTFGSLGAATTAVNTTNTAVNTLISLLSALAIK